MYAPHDLGVLEEVGDAVAVVGEIVDVDRVLDRRIHTEVVLVQRIQRNDVASVHRVEPRADLLRMHDGLQAAPDRTMVVRREAVEARAVEATQQGEVRLEAPLVAGVQPVVVPLVAALRAAAPRAVRTVAAVAAVR